MAVAMAVYEILGWGAGGRGVLMQGEGGLQVEVGAGGLGELAKEFLYGGEALLYGVDLTFAKKGGRGGLALVPGGSVGWTPAWLGLGWMDGAEEGGEKERGRGER